MLVPAVALVVLELAAPVCTAPLTCWLAVCGCKVAPCRLGLEPGGSIDAFSKSGSVKTIS